MSGNRAWLLVLALVAFPHTEWVQDLADTTPWFGAGPALIAVVDALVVAAVIGRPFGRAIWLVVAVLVVDLTAAVAIGDRDAIPGFQEDAGFWVVEGLYAVTAFGLLLVTVHVWLGRWPGGGTDRRPRWVIPFLVGTAVAYAADIIATGTYCDGHPCALDGPFPKGAIPAIDGDFYELSAEIITGLLIAIVVEGAFHASRREQQDRLLRAATVAMLAFAAIFCLASTLAVGTEVGGADAREGVVQVPLAFVVSVQALVTGFAALLMAAREPAAES